LNEALLGNDDLNTGFVVAINIEAKEGEADVVAAILQGLIAPTMKEPSGKTPP